MCSFFFFDFTPLYGLDQNIPLKRQKNTDQGELVPLESDFQRKRGTSSPHLYKTTTFRGRLATAYRPAQISLLQKKSLPLFDPVQCTPAMPQAAGAGLRTDPV